MSSRSNDFGRVYEFICLKTLKEEIGKFRLVNVITDNNYYTYEGLWNALSDEMKNVYMASSKAAVKKIFELEPRILETSNFALELSLQQDNRGEEGDVRDVLIIRHDIHWEIGLSIKHNHFAVKHSRLSKSLDFGEKWYGIPCSQTYWDEVKPIFDYLEEERNNGTSFHDLPNKEIDVYVPLLNAFIKEIRLQYNEHPEIVSRMAEYLLCKYDFYKVISVDREEETVIQTYNLHGTLNQDGEYQNASTHVPVTPLPTSITQIGFVENTNTSVMILMDKGWKFTFRIHNAATLVEPSLKFDINITGLPDSILTFHCHWS